MAAVRELPSQDSVTFPAAPPPLQFRRFFQFLIYFISRVYTTGPTTLEGLKQRIQNEIRGIPIEMWRATGYLNGRLENACIEEDATYWILVPRFSKKFHDLVRCQLSPLPSFAVEAFEKSINDVTCSVVASVDENETFIVETDTCDYSTAATLSQCGRPVTFFSKLLSGSEQIYSDVEKEACAIVEALRKWRNASPQPQNPPASKTCAACCHRVHKNTEVKQLTVPRTPDVDASNTLECHSLINPRVPRAAIGGHKHGRKVEQGGQKLCQGKWATGAHLHHTWDQGSGTGAAVCTGKHIDKFAEEASQKP
ncbi:hypothetical protein PR048_002624 [Dryococelus australis]|uniref:Reverse transcriptase/retrotransposon-derived protein RNase H-like domain-containing protein n=1 Tax=Dryococelus australis TaxID=614101 RepID=A0ABQ9IN38_9NEOP|nr:hypothetical protein PR048_002624 [Dryococelus australis]